ncbi:EB domain-containing protein [Sandaracinus amylolyticus]|uniref:EB domain-containing protein n=1 Tax=Sandaracinus amylolyticus TaxID=927083 RepID=UPI001F28FED1|nr:EB domain-containing protein [Sandaracinus amylolyticus]
MGDTCVPAETITCGAGTTLDEETGECVADVQCATGTVARDGECVPDGSVICTGNTTFDAETGTCVLDPSACAEGTVLVEGECIPYDDSLVPDVMEAAEPNDGLLFEGAPAAFEPPGVGETRTLGGCITPADFDADDVLDVDADSFAFQVTAPGLYEIRAEGLNGLSAGFIVLGTAESLGGWYRLGIDLTSDSASRQIWVPTAGTYVVAVIDSRSLALESLQEQGPAFARPVGSEDTCYFVSVEGLATPEPTAIEPGTRTGTLGDPQFFRVTATDKTVYDVLLDAPSASAQPALVLQQDGDVHAAFGGSPSVSAFSEAIDASGALTIVVDHAYDYSITPVDYALVVTGNDEADGTVTITHRDEAASFVFFEGAAGEVVRFAHEGETPIALDVINSDVTAYLAEICTTGAPCTESESWFQLTETGRYVVVVYNPEGTAGDTYDVTFDVEHITPTALTAGTASTLTLADGWAFATIDTAGVEWGEIALDDLTGTAFTAADVQIFARDEEGFLALVDTDGVLPPIEEQLEATSLARIWLPSQPGQVLLAVRDATAFEGDESAAVTFRERVREDVTFTGAATETRADVTVPASEVLYYLVRAPAAGTVTIEVTGAGTSDPFITQLTREDEADELADATGAGGTETLESVVPASGWVAYAVSAAAADVLDIEITNVPPPYSVGPSTRTFMDICTEETTVANDDEALSDPIALTTFGGFQYFGEAVTEMVVSTNGWLTFDGSYAGNESITFGAASAPNAVIAPFAADLVTRVCVRQTAAEMILQWSGETWGFPPFIPIDPVEMQVVLLADGSIELVYGAAHGATVEAGTLGLEAATAGVVIGGDATRAVAGSAMRFTPN